MVSNEECLEKHDEKYKMYDDFANQCLCLVGLGLARVKKALKTFELDYQKKKKKFW